MSEGFDQTEVNPGDVLAGKYQVDRVIGEGGMGVVVAATHTVLKERVALKFLLPHVVENEAIAARFLREAQAAARIKSPHVARAMDVGTLESGSPYMVMEYLEGKDLGTLLEKEGPLEPEVACMFALQTCEALAAAHAAGIIHRDIKPGNIFITKSPDGSPHVKVLDFGISKITSDIGGAALTATQVSMGSPLYMSPEQMRSARTVDCRADLWSLGVVVYEMLSGALPFDADSMPQLCALVLESTAPPLSILCPDLPEGLDGVLARCLERNPEDRFSDAGELAQALAPFAGPNGPASAMRSVRITEGAGMGKTLDLKSMRESASEIREATAEPSPLKDGTGTAFGKTEAPTEEKTDKRRSSLVWAAAAAVVLIGGGALWATKQKSAAPVLPSAEQASSAAAAPGPAEDPAKRDNAEETSQPQPVPSQKQPEKAAADAAPPPSAATKRKVSPAQQRAWLEAQRKQQQPKPKPKPKEPESSVFDDRK